MVTIRYQLECPQVTNPRIQNNVLPWDMSPEVEFNMLSLLCLIIFPSWDMETISNPVNGIDHPVIETKK